MADLGSGAQALVRALAPSAVPATSESACRRLLAELVPEPSPNEAWLVLSVLTRRLPLSADVLEFRRLARSQGMGAAIEHVHRSRRSPLRWRDLPVHIITDSVLLDIHESALTSLSTGVQRVSRSLADAWMPRGAVLLGWSSGRTQLLPLRPDAWSSRSRRSPFQRKAIVPWGGHFVLPEVVTDVGRTRRTAALAEFSGARSMLIGDDAIPLTTAETTGPGMPGAFAKYLVAASRMRVVACISKAAATEYAGWKSMLASAGLEGPEVRTVMLAETAPEPDPVYLEAAKRTFIVSDERGELPLVLCVGSHEPRKNHDAVLHAAELLWRSGARFRLAFVGGNSWNSEAFHRRLAELRDSGRPVAALRGVSDAELWWGYRLARFTVFPSFNEGFGLPVAESLQIGTPAIASNFGSLAEIAEGGGCLLVDPRDDSSIAEAMRTLLEDDELRDRLAAEAAARPERPWATYADEVWRVLME